MKHIFLLRHGSISKAERYIGVTDAEMSAEGYQQIMKAKAFLSQHSFDHIYSSPLKRCIQTAETLKLANNLTPDERLKEVNFGAWEGRKFDEIATSFPTEVAQWSNAMKDFCFPAGESISNFHNRINSFCNELQQCSGTKILLICHGGVIRHIICSLLNLDFSNYLYFKVDYGSLATIDLFSEGGILTGLNRGV